MSYQDNSGDIWDIFFTLVMVVVDTDNIFEISSYEYVPLDR